jgi:hypothetical protein
MVWRNEIICAEELAEEQSMLRKEEAKLHSLFSFIHPSHISNHRSHTHLFLQLV